MSDNINGFPVPEEPETREEQYLSAIAQVTPATQIPPEPLTRVEAYLNKIVENGGGGGGGGTTNYNALENKPQINSHELSGNKSSSDLGLQAALTEAQQAAVDSGIDSTKVEQIETNKTNISLLHNEIYYNNTYAVDNIDSESTANATNAKKWIAVILPENAVVSYIKQAVVGNSADIVKLEKWEENNGVFTLSSTVTASSITQESGKYVLNFAGFTTRKRTLITFSDTSSLGWLQYKNVSGYNCQKFDANLTSITEANISDTANIKLYVEYEYTMQGKKGAYIVDINGSGDYTSLVQAVSELSSGSTILVKPGVYEGTVRAFQKRLNILGTDRKKCIIRSTDGRYENPAIECCCGYLFNLTIESKYISGTSHEISSSDSGAYAIHCENSGNERIAIGDCLTIENCDIISDFFPAMGVGTFKDWSININNCTLISNQVSGRGTYTADGGLGALYFHDMNGTKGTANINLKDTIIRTGSLANTITAYDLNQANAEIKCEFINNTIYSAVNGFTDSIWWRGITTPFENHISLEPISHGNTGTVFNS